MKEFLPRKPVYRVETIRRIRIQLQTGVPFPHREGRESVWTFVAISPEKCGADIASPSAY